MYLFKFLFFFFYEINSSFQTYLWDNVKKNIITIMFVTSLWKIFFCKDWYRFSINTIHYSVHYSWLYNWMLFVQAEARAEFAERSVQKLQKEVDRLEGMFLIHASKSPVHTIPNIHTHRNTIVSLVIRKHYRFIE